LDATVEGAAVRPPKTTSSIDAPLSDHYGFLAEVELENRE
jgi:hypothetical protein